MFTECCTWQSLLELLKTPFPVPVPVPTHALLLLVGRVLGVDAGGCVIHSVNIQ
jgi:hypothetical protein